MDPSLPRHPKLFKTKSWTLQSELLDDSPSAGGNNVVISDVHSNKKSFSSVVPGSTKPFKKEPKSDSSSSSSTGKSDNSNYHEAIYDIVEAQDLDAIVKIEFIVDELAKKGLFREKISTDSMNMPSLPIESSIHTVANAIPTLTMKQCHSIVGKNIREMIKNGWIVGLPLTIPGGKRGRGMEYSYKVNPMYHKHDFATTPVLCMNKDRVPLRVFHSIQECEDLLGLSFDRILKVCRGIQRNSRGLVFDWWSPNSFYRSPESFNDGSEAVSVADICSHYITVTKSSPRAIATISPAINGAGSTTQLHDRAGVLAGSNLEGRESVSDRSSKRARKIPRPIDDTYEKPIEGSGKARSRGLRDSTKDVGSSEVKPHGIFFKGSDDTLTATCTVLICDGCEDEYFLDQVGLSKVPEGDWYCEKCRNRTLIICDGCDGEYFLDEVGLVEVPNGDWYCTNCRNDRIGVGSSRIMPQVRHIATVDHGESDGVDGIREVKSEPCNDDNNSNSEGQNHSIIFLGRGAYTSRRELDIQNELTNNSNSNSAANIESMKGGKTITTDNTVDKVGLSNVDTKSVLDAIQGLHTKWTSGDISSRPVTFRTVCQHLHPHLFASADRNCDEAYKIDERIVLAIIDSFDQLLFTGQVIERVGGIRTPGDNFRLQGRRRRTNVPAPRSPHVRVWPPIVRFYDDENNLDMDEVRVPPERRKTYSPNPVFHTAETAFADRLIIEVTTVRGTVLHVSPTTEKCAVYFRISESLLLQCCNGVLSEIGGLLFRWKADTTANPSSLIPERILPPVPYGIDYPLLRTHSLARRVLQLIEDICGGTLFREVDAEEIYASLLTEFAHQKYFPIHIEEALDILHRRGFITLPPSPGSDLNNKMLSDMEIIEAARLRPLPRYRLNPHHRTNLLTTAVLCMNLNDEPLHIFRNLADIANKIHLRPENVIKVCLKSNIHGGGEAEDNKWPKSHSNLKFKWADEMTTEEEVALAELRHEDDMLDSYGAGGKTDPVDRIHRSLEAWFSRAGSNGSTNRPTEVPAVPPPMSTRKRRHVPSVKALERDNDGYFFDETSITVTGVNQSSKKSSPRTDGDPAADSDSDDWVPPPNLRRSLSINSQFNDQRRNSLDENNNAHSEKQVTYSSSLRAYCERHSIAEASVENIELPFPIGISPPKSAICDDKINGQTPCGRSIPCHVLPQVNGVLSPRGSPFSQNSSPVTRPFDIVGASKRKWALSSQDLQCFANSSSKSVDLRTWDDALTLTPTSQAGGGHATVTSTTPLDVFMEHAKKFLFNVGTVFRAKIFNNERKVFESKVVVVVSTNAQTTHFTEAYRLTVFSGTLPLHTISLNECPFEFEDVLWECWCAFSAYETAGLGNGSLSLMDALKNCVEDLKCTMARQRWLAPQVQCVLPQLLKRHSRTAVYLTAEPDLIRSFKVLRANYPDKTMKDLVRLYYLISDHRGKTEVKEKDRKEQYRQVLRVYMCSDFLLDSSSSSTDLLSDEVHVSDSDIQEWLHIYSSYSFVDLF